MPSNTDILNTSNVLDLSLDEIRDICFRSIPTHEKAVSLDPDKYVTLLGLYPALYQYFSEIYVYLIARTRAFSEAKNQLGKIKAMDRRDCLEQILKTIKFEYDGLSRKTTILSMESVDA